MIENMINRKNLKAKEWKNKLINNNKLIMVVNSKEVVTIIVSNNSLRSRICRNSRFSNNL